MLLLLSIHLICCQGVNWTLLLTRNSRRRRKPINVKLVDFYFQLLLFPSDGFFPLHTLSVLRTPNVYSTDVIRSSRQIFVTHSIGVCNLHVYIYAVIMAFEYFCNYHVRNAKIF